LRHKGTSEARAWKCPSLLTIVAVSVQEKSDGLKAKLYGKFGKLVQQACDPTLIICSSIGLQSYNRIQAGSLGKL
jgi:hypothetical protein